MVNLATTIVKILSLVWVLFPFVLGMIMYDNEIKTNGNII